ncbi:MAG: cobalamin B12-binding domain-containing protein, partial [Candidatus Helarchaeota archaeon]|nr:cobalamin B12-binding domain-containing protein [Candidatus Helarchaeota archaeon]
MSQDKMKILLVNPITRKYHKGISIQAQAPLGLLSLASVLRENGHKIKLFDHNVENGIKDCLKFEPELIGVTAFTGPMILDALHLSKIFRERLEVPVCFGGVHASLLPVQTVSHPSIDMVVVGEGEEIIVELAERIERRRDLESIKGLVWKKGNNGKTRIVENEPRPLIRDLDALPFPAWDLIDERKYKATSMGIERSSSTLYS